MRKFKFDKSRIKTLRNITLISICSLILAFSFSNNVFADELVLQGYTSSQFQQWENLSDEEKENTIMPGPSGVRVDNSIEDEEKTSNMIANLFAADGKLSNPSYINLVGKSYTDSSYSSKDVISNIRVENQRNTGECWAFSTIKSLEINYAIENGLQSLPNYSERHMDYATSTSFSDGTNDKAYSRAAGVGMLNIGYAYLTNGTGAVNEEDMPFEDNDDSVTLSSIDKEAKTIATGYRYLGGLYKDYEKDSSGNTTKVTYYDSSDVTSRHELSSETVTSVRNAIKKQIVENGSISTNTYASGLAYYSYPKNYLSSTNYNCNNSSSLRDHAVLIVGWDDNYSKDNFVFGHRPSTDGAYLVLNSYGTDIMLDGYYYISYEDVIIEQEMFGVESSKNKDYDNLYQNDFYGGIYDVGNTSVNSGYIATSYSRDVNKNETLNSVGITTANNCNVKIYVDASGSDLENGDYELVGEAYNLTPGYHRIDINKTKLTGSTYGIKVALESTEGFNFKVELNVNQSGSPYKNVTSSGNSYFSFDGANWKKLNDVEITGFDMASSDVCIKGFTTYNAVEEETNDNDANNNDDNSSNGQDQNDKQNNEGNDEDTNVSLKSDLYIIKDKDIYDVSYNTTIEEFENNLIYDGTIKIYDEANNEKTDPVDLVHTGDVIELENNDKYTIIVRGDIDKDGMVTITDLSKIISHYAEKRGFILTGTNLKGADMNFDGEVNLIDVSKMVVLYSKI